MNCFKLIRYDFKPSLKFTQKSSKIHGESSELRLNIISKIIIIFMIFSRIFLVRLNMCNNNNSKNIKFCIKVCDYFAMIFLDEFWMGFKLGLKSYKFEKITKMFFFK